MAVAIIDYGSGNLRSAAKAFESQTDLEIQVTADVGLVAAANHIVLPGVGAFGDCRRGRNAVPGMVETLQRTVIDGGRPFLGICVGMQLMAARGLEHGVHEGFGWIAGDVVAVEPDDPMLKVPHMGWNDLTHVAGHPVLEGLDHGAHAYFVHSYHMVPADPAQVLATVDYGGALTAIVGRDNMIGTQFHPEKSQAAGLALIRNFVQWRP